DGREAKTTRVVGQTAAEAAESRLDRLVLRVFRMRVLALGIGLPDFDDGVVDRFAVAGDDAAGEADAFAADARAGEVDHDDGREADPDVRADGLRCGGELAHGALSCGSIPSASRRDRA